MNNGYTEVCEKTGNERRGWHRCYDRGGKMRRFDLALMYEYDGICDGPYNNIDEDDWSPTSFLRYAVDTLRNRYPDWYQNDAAQLQWSLTDSGEHAPFDVNNHKPDCNFLAYYTWPVDVRTGKPVNWYSLPVTARVPELEEVLGFKPAALQPTVPIRTIVEQMWMEDGVPASKYADF